MTYKYLNKYSCVLLFSDDDVVDDADLYQLSLHIPYSSAVTFFVTQFDYKGFTVQNELDQISKELDTRKVFKLWHKGTKTVEDLERLIQKKKGKNTSRIIKVVEETLLRKMIFYHFIIYVVSLCSICIT